jgi:hypothetical protein
LADFGADLFLALKSGQPGSGKPDRRRRAPQPKFDPDVLDVVREEQSRGKRPVDIEERNDRKSSLRDLPFSA